MRTVVALLLLALAPVCFARIIEVGGHKGWTMNINGQWTQPDVYMWDQLLFPIKQNFIKPDDVWMMANQSAWMSCDFSAATFIGNASVGNDILTPPYLLSYPADFFFAAEANNGCQANQKIKITVLEGAAPPDTASQFPPAPAPAPAPTLPTAPAPAPVVVVRKHKRTVVRETAPAPNAAPSAFRLLDGLVLAVAAVLGAVAVYV